MNQSQRDRVDAVTREIHDLGTRVAAMAAAAEAAEAADAEDETRVANLEEAVAGLKAQLPAG